MGLLGDLGNLIAPLGSKDIDEFVPNSKKPTFTDTKGGFSFLEELPIPGIPGLSDITAGLGGAIPGLDAITGGTASSEARAGEGAQSSSGSNFVNVGNPLQNIGSILQALNSGSAVSGGFPTSFASPITRLNDGTILPDRIGLRGDGGFNFTPFVIGGAVLTIGAGALFFFNR